MKKLLPILFVFACENFSTNDTTKNTYFDDISDITFLNGSFFTTNYDISSNSGSQIDLIKFTFINDDSIFLDNSYDLNMNGQGYLAITNNGIDIFLQSKVSHLLIKYSSIGEFAYMNIDTINTNWQPCGLTFKSDSLVSLYRNLESPTQYRVRTIAQNLSSSASSDIIFNLDFIDTTYHGVYAIDSKNSSYYMLGRDTSRNDILIITNNSFEVTELDTIPDSTIVGLCFKNNDLYFSYKKRKIKKWIKQ